MARACMVPCVLAAGVMAGGCRQLPMNEKTTRCRMLPQQSRRASWLTRFLTRRLPLLARWQASLGAAFPHLRRRTALVSALLLLTIFMGPNGVLTNLPVVHAQGTTSAASQG